MPRPHYIQCSAVKTASRQKNKNGQKVGEVCPLYGEAVLWEGYVQDEMQLFLGVITDNNL